MADNFLERQYDDYLQAKARRDLAKKLLWRKRLAAYKKRLSSPPPQNPTDTPPTPE